VCWAWLVEHWAYYAVWRHRLGLTIRPSYIPLLCTYGQSESLLTCLIASELHQTVREATTWCNSPLNMSADSPTVRRFGKLQSGWFTIDMLLHDAESVVQTWSNIARYGTDVKTDRKSGKPLIRGSGWRTVTPARFFRCTTHPLMGASGLLLPRSWKS